MTEPATANNPDIANDITPSSSRLHDGPSFVANALPAGAQDYLKADNPRLLELRSRYEEFSQFGHTLWTRGYLDGELDIAHFRGDNAYNWQVRGGIQEIQYALTAYFAMTNDRLKIFDRLLEDDLFGAYTYDFNGKIISRDLLDSVIQINFLEKYVGLSNRPNVTIFDLGAGYGRLAWRLSEALPNAKKIWCSDAIPESTFLCEYYLRFRGASDNVQVLPLDKIGAALLGQKIDIVTNVHSFTECTIEAIGWWLSLLSAASVTYLMIVPNTRDRLLSMEADGNRVDFQPLIEQFGYRLVKKEDAYEGAPTVQRFGVYSGTHWLFERD